jgi:site-specific DNA-methyltransferase (adenine-specific)
MFILCKGKPKTFNPLKLNKIPKYISNKPRICFSRQLDDHIRKDIFIPNRIDKMRGNIWKYNAGFNQSTKDKIAFQNPAIFPEKLAEDHILSWSNKGNLIYDPFGGSGTTAKMAIKNDRKWILSEISKEYCEIIEQRLKEPIKQIKRKEKILDWLKED